MHLPVYCDWDSLETPSLINYYFIGFLLNYWVCGEPLVRWLSLAVLVQKQPCSGSQLRQLDASRGGEPVQWVPRRPLISVGTAISGGWPSRRTPSGFLDRLR